MWGASVLYLARLFAAMSTAELNLAAMPTADDLAKEAARDQHHGRSRRNSEDGDKTGRERRSRRSSNDDEKKEKNMRTEVM